MIDHGHGLTSLYARMSRVMTQLGAQVGQGTVIGRVGATGNVTGPHLHLEARYSGAAVDPMTYLSGGEATLYDSGGYLPTGLSLTANGTGSPEPVFTPDQWATLRANVANGGPTDVHADVRVYVGDREITDIVRTEVVAREASTAALIDTGRRL